MSPDPAGSPESLIPTLVEAARRFGTPCYVTDLAALDRAATELGRAFPDPWIRQFSLKANPLPAVVARLAAEGVGANVVSAGEWAAATKAGLPNHLISLEGIGKTDSELEMAVETATKGEPLRWVTVESSDEMTALAKAARGAGLGGSGRSLDLLLRLNPAVDSETRAGFQVGSKSSKFGMPEQELRELVKLHSDSGSGLTIRGIHVHVGSQLGATEAWAAGGVTAAHLLAELARDRGELDTVDFGGGFPAASGPALADFRVRLDQRLADAGVELPRRPAVEPGRCLVASAGWLLARVLHVRQERPRRQVVIDASMSELIRPALYNARHELVALTSARGSSPEWAATEVEGAVCESTDTFGVHDLPPLKRGDLVALATTGAYASSMFSHYNGRPRPPEVLIHPDHTLTLARPGTPFAP
ncbi:MAG: type III PLP-dependent enzyme domain-containing protein [Candidatus Dormibacteria bacterium]